MSTAVHYPLHNAMSQHYTLWESIWNYRVFEEPNSAYRDFHLQDEFPAIRPLMLESEMQWDKADALTRSYRLLGWVPILASVVYLLAIFGGRRMMRDRKAWDLKAPLAVWNLLLAVFSVLGTTRLVPHLVYGLLINHHTYFFCRNAGSSYGHGSEGLWVNLFICSKLFELVDTAFLVLRKKQVSFLHWFHHATVLLYCWHAGQYQMPTGIFFASMNYVVHSIMYFYYFLAAVTKPPRWGKTVTVLQITQMFLGMFVTAYHYYLLKTVPNCDGSYENLLAAFAMYTAYMLLFVQFFVGRYAYSSSRSRSGTPIAKPKYQ